MCYACYSRKLILLDYLFADGFKLEGFKANLLASGPFEESAEASVSSKCKECPTGEVTTFPQQVAVYMTGIDNILAPHKALVLKLVTHHLAMVKTMEAIAPQGPPPTVF